MFKRFVIGCLVLSTTIINAQAMELGFVFGGSSYVGDIGSPTYFAPTGYSAGVIYKWNVHDRVTLRTSLSRILISGDDSSSKNKALQNRDYSFKNTLHQVSLGTEINFSKFVPNDFKPQITPYIFTGFTFFNYDKLFLSNRELIKEGKESSFGIPISLGLKTNIFELFVFSSEINATYTFTDNLDGSEYNITNEQFGSTYQNDWYFNLAVVFSLIINRKYCKYCEQ